MSICIKKQKQKEHRKNKVNARISPFFKDLLFGSCENIHQSKSRFIFIRHSHSDSDSCADDGAIGLRF